MDSTSYYKRVLPLIDAMLDEPQHELVQQQGLHAVFCFGPSMEDVERWMPRTMALLDSWGNRAQRLAILPPDPDMHFEWIYGQLLSWLASLKAQDEHFDRNGVFTLWLPPLGFDLATSLKRFEKLPENLTKDTLRHLPLGLALGLFGTHEPLSQNHAGVVSVCAVPDDALMTDAVVEVLRRVSEVSQCTAFDGWPPSLRRAPEEVLLRIGFPREANGGQRPSVEHHAIELHPLLPAFSYRLAQPDAAAVTLIGLRALDSSDRSGNQSRQWVPSHFCSLLENWNASGLDEGAVSEMIRFREGVQQRTEDHSYPLWSLVADLGHWTPSLSCSAAEHLIPRLGHQPLGLSGIGVLKKWEGRAEGGSSNGEGLVYFKTAGPGAPYATIQVPEQEPACEYYTTSTKTPQFLSWVLNSEPVRAAFRDAAGGTYRAPRMSENGLKQLSIPWPAKGIRMGWESHRNRLLTFINKSVEELGYVAERLHEHEAKLDGLDDASMYFPFYSMTELDTDVESELQVLHNLLSPLRGPDVNWHPGPYPIALWERKRKFADNVHSELESVWWLLEVRVRIDACMCLAIVQWYKGQKFTPKSESKRNDELRARMRKRMAIGDWVYIASESRKWLSDHTADQRLGRFQAAMGLGNIKPHTAKKLIENAFSTPLNDAVNIRNTKTTAHNTPSTEHNKSDIIKQIDAKIQDARRLLAYQDNMRLFHGRAERAPNGFRVTRWILNGPSHAFERHDAFVKEGEPLARIHTGEVYAEIQGELVGLHPWVIWHEDELWLYDGMERTNEVTYQPVSSGDRDKLKRSEEYEVIHQYISAL